MLFSKLFGKRDQTPQYDGSPFLDFNSQGVSISGNQVGFPVRLEVLEGILGRAEKFELKAGINYCWSNLGIFCYTKDGVSVYAFGATIVPKSKSVSFIPDKPYEGRITVCGKPWEKMLRSGEKTEVFYRLMLGRYSIVSEFIDWEDDSVLTDIEINANTY